MDKKSKVYFAMCKQFKAAVKCNEQLVKVEVKGIGIARPFLMVGHTNVTRFYL